MSEIIRYEQQDALATLPLDRFDELLQQGQIAEALDLRMDAIESNAREHRTDCEAAKFSAAGLAVAGLLMSASPVIGLLGGLGAVAYGVTLFQDYQKTKRFCPIPAVRKTLPELLTGVGNAADRVESTTAEDPLADVLAFVEPPVAHEYELLQVHGIGGWNRHLQQFAPAKRFLVYKETLRWTRLRGSLALPSLQQLASAEDRLQPEAPVIEYADYASTEPAPTDAIDVPATEIQPPASEPAVNLNVNPEINVHNHIGKQGQPHRTASPAQSDRRTSAPDLSLYPDIRERMTVLLKAMAESGLPLGTLLNHPFVSCWGRSQSGKTTIALLLATARLAMGHQVSYFTTDDDYPRSLPWQRVEDTPEGYAVALDDAVATMSAAGKGKLKGQGWVFDELFAAAAQHKIEIQPLLTCVLMKGAKCGAGSIGISQADTSSAHGMKGIDTAWREERVSVQAIHEEDAIGDRHPTGRYIINRGEESQEWCIPEWMLTELNAEGSPDPMIWVLNRFPELSKPATVSTVAKTQERQGTTGNEIGNDAGNDGNGNEISSPNSGTKFSDEERTGTTQERDFQPIHLDSGTFLERFPGTTEATVFAQILDGYGNGFSPSDIVKRSLGLNKRYAEGKAACCYLVRKHGNAALFAHFEKWLEEGQ